MVPPLSAVLPHLWSDASETSASRRIPGTVALWGPPEQFALWGVGGWVLSARQFGNNITGGIQHQAGAIYPAAWAVAASS